MSDDQRQSATDSGANRDLTLPADLRLTVRIEEWPIAGSFTISRGSKTSARVVVAELETDGEKLRQILLNFLSNALKFTDQGGVAISVSRHDGGETGAHPLAICVSDSGIGIPEEKHDLVFEAFKQADGSTSRRYGGTGLGLTISRELAQLIGGRIEIDSREGSGSTFTLLLPLSIEDSRETIPFERDVIFEFRRRTHTGAARPRIQINRGTFPLEKLRLFLTRYSNIPTRS